MVFMMIRAGTDPERAPTTEQRAVCSRTREWRAGRATPMGRLHRWVFPAKDLDHVRFVDVTEPELEPWFGRTLADLIAARGGHPSDVLADWVLENDLRPGIVVVGIANGKRRRRRQAPRRPRQHRASSDAGAHFQMMCAAGDTTLFLARHVRDRGDLTVEAAVHELSGKQSDVFGFATAATSARASGRPHGVRALDELHWDDDVFVTDQPGGARRLRRPEGGFRYTIANGEITQRAGRLTDARPAGVLHSAFG